MKGYAFFTGDSSVGESDQAFDFEVPDFDDEFREEVRAKLVEAYNWMHGDSTCFVVFDGERDTDPDVPEFDPYGMGDGVYYPRGGTRDWG